MRQITAHQELTSAYHANCLRDEHSRIVRLTQKKAPDAKRVGVGWIGEAVKDCLRTKATVISLDHGICTRSMASCSISSTSTTSVSRVQEFWWRTRTDSIKRYKVLLELSANSGDEPESMTYAVAQKVGQISL